MLSELGAINPPSGNARAHIPPSEPGLVGSAVPTVRVNGPPALTRDFSTKVAGGASDGCHIAVVGIEHDGLLLVVRYWPTCTEVGYVRGLAAKAYQQVDSFTLLYRRPGAVRVVHASLSADICYLAITTWHPVVPEAAGKHNQQGSYNACVLRVYPSETNRSIYSNPDVEDEDERTRENLQSLGCEMQSPASGLQFAAKDVLGGGFDRCFTGEAAVNWLLQRCPSLRGGQDRSHASQLGQNLLAAGVISAVNGGHSFSDEPGLMYRFEILGAGAVGSREVSSAGLEGPFDERQRADSSTGSIQGDSQPPLSSDADKFGGGEAQRLHGQHERRQRRRGGMHMPQLPMTGGVGRLGYETVPPTAVEIPGCRVSDSREQPSIHFVNRDSFCDERAGELHRRQSQSGQQQQQSKRTPTKRAACCFLLCHQGIKHFLVRESPTSSVSPPPPPPPPPPPSPPPPPPPPSPSSATQSLHVAEATSRAAAAYVASTHPLQTATSCDWQVQLVRHFVWSFYNPSHRLLYYIAVTGVQDEFLLLLLNSFCNYFATELRLLIRGDVGVETETQRPMK